MTTEAAGIQRIVGASVRDMLDAYGIQAAVGPVGEKALEEILFRASHGVLRSLAPYPREQRVPLLPSVVRLLLAAFLEEVVGPGRLVAGRMIADNAFSGLTEILGPKPRSNQSRRRSAAMSLPKSTSMTHETPSHSRPCLH